LGPVLNFFTFHFFTLPFSLFLFGQKGEREEKNVFAVEKNVVNDIYYKLLNLLNLLNLLTKAAGVSAVSSSTLFFFSPNTSTAESRVT